MIKTKEDYLFYLEADRIALRINRRKPSFFRGAQQEIWVFERLLRKLEYYTNCKKNKLITMILRYKYSNLSIKLGYSIPINVFGPGLSIAHVGTIIINAESQVGENCRIQTGVTLGSTNGSSKAPILGNNIYLGDGCKIIGDISIADDVCIGANAVVTKSIESPKTTWGGGTCEKDK